MIKNFQIQNTKLFVNTNNFLKNKFTVKSFPRNYEVKISNKYSDFKKGTTLLRYSSLCKSFLRIRNSTFSIKQ